VSLLKPAKGIDLGLHVTLNAEWQTVKWRPVLPTEEVVSLLEPGSPFFTAAPRKLAETGFSLEEAIAEVDAQLGHLRSRGLSIAYMDEHMGVGSLPGLRSALKEICRREGILHLASLDLMRLPALTEKPLVDRWLEALQKAPPGTYLVVTHPGRMAPDMNAFFEIGGTPGVIAKERDAERRALADVSLKQGLGRLAINSVRFSDL
jgi:predicted glycoside hydrolase/deacetylase ChbG (UPF0249 family)